MCAEVRPAYIVTDENPLGGLDGWRKLLPENFVLPFVTVDADVVVPSALITKEQFAARTIRPRLNALIPQFLQPVGNRAIDIKYRDQLPLSLTPGLDLLNSLSLDHSVGAVPDSKGGTTHALERLDLFVRERLATYPDTRSHPELDGTSQLLPYLHFGQIGPHTIAIAVREADAPERARHAFPRRAHHTLGAGDQFRALQFPLLLDTSAGPWALATLRDHADDPRPHRYSERQLEDADTHDELWNAAQRQMVIGGWMHNYMRMYWAKKILERSDSPAAAYHIAVRLNDRYELDGRDPNSYARIACAIAGKHDRAWGPERPIYGKIRYMSAASTGRKFNSRAYIERWRK